MRPRRQDASDQSPRRTGGPNLVPMTVRRNGSIVGGQGMSAERSGEVGGAICRQSIGTEACGMRASEASADQRSDEGSAAVLTLAGSAVIAARGTAATRDGGNGTVRPADRSVRRGETRPVLLPFAKRTVGIEEGLSRVERSQDATDRRTGTSITLSSNGSTSGNGVRELTLVGALDGSAPLRTPARSTMKSVAVPFRRAANRSESTRFRSRITGPRATRPSHERPMTIPFRPASVVVDDGRRNLGSISLRRELRLSIAALSVDGRPAGAVSTRTAWSSSGALVSAGRLASRFLLDRARRRSAA